MGLYTYNGNMFSSHISSKIPFTHASEYIVQQYKSTKNPFGFQSRSSIADLTDFHAFTYSNINTELSCDMYLREHYWSM